MAGRLEKVIVEVYYTFPKLLNLRLIAIGIHADQVAEALY